MDDHIIMRVKSLLDRPLPRYPLPAALLDHYIIVNLKIEHAPTKQLLDERDDLELELRKVLSDVTDREKFLELIQRLVEFHRDMWKVEDMVRDKGLSVDQRGAMALKADMKNDERAKLKTEINALFGLKPGSEAKIRKT